MWTNEIAPIGICAISDISVQFSIFVFCSTNKPNAQYPIHFIRTDGVPFRLSQAFIWNFKHLIKWPATDEIRENKNKNGKNGDTLSKQIGKVPFVFRNDERRQTKNVLSSFVSVFTHFYVRHTKDIRRRAYSLYSAGNEIEVEPKNMFFCSLFDNVCSSPKNG